MDIINQTGTARSVQFLIILLRTTRVSDQNTVQLARITIEVEGKISLDVLKLF